jgi:hypothetical protein
MRDRLRSSISADSGSILAAARAVPFDASHSIAFNPTTKLNQQTLYEFREVTRVQDAGPVDAVFFPRATQNQAFERAYDGVTTLSLMGRVYPPALVGQATELGLADGTAQSWITHALEQWATEYLWFTHEAVPDLRHPIPGSSGIALPSEYGATDGVVESNAIKFKQDDDTRLSMLEILESLLSPFPGTVFFINSSGNLQIVPAHGPDADETAYRTLTDELVTQQSLGEPSAFNIINRATVASRGLRIGLTPIMPPAWFQIGARDLYGVTADSSGNPVWYDPAVDRVNLQEPEVDDGLVIQEQFDSTRSFSAQTPLGWQPAEENLFVADAIQLYDQPSGDPLPTAAYKQYNTFTSPPAYVGTGSGTLSLVNDTILTNGAWRSTIKWEATIGLINFVLFLDARWNAPAQQVEWRIGSGSGDLAFNAGPANRVRLVVEFTLDDLSEGFVDQAGPGVTYGVEGQPLYAESVSPSQAAYGVLEERLDVSGYYLDQEQALAIAQGYVLANITPRATREVELGWLGSTQVLFDDRGRRVELPDGQVGRLVGVSYSDDFVSVSGGKSVRIEVELPGEPGSLPDGTLLLNDDGSFWQNDDGTTSEVA